MDTSASAPAKHRSIKFSTPAAAPPVSPVIAKSNFARPTAATIAGFPDEELDEKPMKQRKGSITSRFSLRKTRKSSIADSDARASRPRPKSFDNRYHASGLELSVHEQAFMPGDLLKRLGNSAGQLPPAPSLFASSGAVLFVDVSGFTALDEKLGKEHLPVKASEKLATTITKVLEVLARVCLDCDGEVGKFAGDALLCVWEMKDIDKAETFAKHCAIQMLIEIEKLNKKEDLELQIHGGIAKGSIVHFHFGSIDDDLRWYLISGEAVTAATTLANVLFLIFHLKQ